MKLLKNYELNNVSGGWTKLEVIRNGETVTCTNPKNPAFLFTIDEILKLLKNGVKLETVPVNGLYFDNVLIRNVAYRCVNCQNASFIVEKLLGENAKIDLHTLVFGN